MGELTPERITIISGLLAILIAGYKRMWVWGYQYCDEEKEKNEWKEIALGLLRTTERQTDVLEKKIAGKK